MIKINKELQRPDGGNVAAGSILDYNTKFIGKGKMTMFTVFLYYSREALDDGKVTVPSITDFKFRLTKKCSDQEWIDVMTKANAGELTQGWLKDLVDAKIGLGNTEII